MRYQTAISICALFLSAGAANAATYPVGSQNESAPEVIAFYDAQCASYADLQALTGEARRAYLSNCNAQAKDVWPVGFEVSKGGDD
ncbi:MAG: hypothetical protein H6981_05115 [Gammaproteobacteria bacterium]|nr:hypothetical protein [Gammaproteobacteria bacterium]MCP5136161.1 hypothetical protein [Gammaproteobacteria bacterium]